MCDLMIFRQYCR